MPLASSEHDLDARSLSGRPPDTRPPGGQKPDSVGPTSAMRTACGAEARADAWVPDTLASGVDAARGRMGGCLTPSQGAWRTREGYEARSVAP
jgi:hypothetical protein